MLPVPPLAVHYLKERGVLTEGVRVRGKLLNVLPERVHHGLTLLAGGAGGKVLAAGGLHNLQQKTGGIK